MKIAVLILTTVASVNIFASNLDLSKYGKNINGKIYGDK